MTTKIKHSNLTQPILGEFNTTSVDATVNVTSVDTFIYDTRKDSDGGAWRKRTQNTSWYNETLNTATRGSRKEFPAVAVIVAETDKVTIYDGDDTAMPMWMVFIRGNSYWTKHDTAIASIAMLNGMLVVGGDTRLGIVEFAADKGNMVETLYNYEHSHIANRHTPVGPATGSLRIIHNIVNDVAMTVLPNAPIDPVTGLPVPTIAVATDGGTSIIKDNGTVVDLTGASYGHGLVKFLGGEKMYLGVRNIGTGGNSLYGVFLDRIPSEDIDLDTTSVYNLVTTSSSAGNYVYPDVNTRRIPSDGDGSAADAVRTGNGTALALTGSLAKVIAEGVVGQTNNQGVSSVVITSEYNTGWMTGDIKLAALSDTDTTDAVDTNLIATSTLDSTDRLASHTYTSGSTTFSLTEDSDAGTGAGYVWIEFNVPLGKSYAVSVQCDTAFTPDGQTRLVNVTTGVDVFPGQGTTDLRTLTFDHNDATGGLILYSSPVAGSTVAYTLSISEAEEDRSVNNSPIQVLGTITKTAVATGADLVGYSGFSASNYLSQPYNSDMHINTGFAVYGWVKLTSNGWNTIFGAGTIADRSLRSLMTRPEGHLTFHTGTEVYYSDAIVPVGVWTFVALRVHSATSASLSINEEHNTFAMVSIADPAAGNPVLIGTNIRWPNDFMNGSLSLIRVSYTIPSDRQLKKIYEDEKRLFQENAQATLYGTSNDVTALAYDDDTELLHAGTSSGRSVFQGLRRVDNTPTAVGVSISASNSMVLED